MTRPVCPLLWESFQIDLEGGRVKACCKTPFERLADDAPFGDFLNLPQARAARAEMLGGALPAACESCRREEEMGLESYRVWFGERGPLAAHALPLAIKGRTDNGSPGHLELIFSTTCNLRCVYCGPDFSSSWRAAEGLKEPAGSATAARRRDAFWSWFAENAEHCRSIQINGGEPLLDPAFGATLGRLAVALAGKPDRRLALVTNLSLGGKALERNLPVLADAAGLVPLVVGVSVDGVGERAEALRPGLRWSRFDANLRRLAAALPDVTIELTPTLGARSIATIDSLCAYAEEVAADSGRRIGLRPGVLVEPRGLSVFALPGSDARVLEGAADRVSRMNCEWVDGLPALAAQLRRLATAMRHGDGA